MPIDKLIFILVAVVMLAAITIAAFSAVVGPVTDTSLGTLGILSLIALCASMAWRRYSGRTAERKPSDE